MCAENQCVGPHAKGDASLNSVEARFVRFEDVTVSHEDDQ